MMTVMQVLPALVTGGVERGTVDIAKALVKQGHRAIVVSSGGPMVKALIEAGAQHITLPVHSKNIMVMRRNANALAKQLRCEQIDIVHARSRAPAWSCYWASQKTATPFVTTFHGTYGHSNRLKRWYNAVMCRGDRIIAVSDFIARHIANTYAVDQARIQTIHRGVDMQQFDPSHVPPNSVSNLSQKWQLKQNQTVIMLPGRLTRWKGQLILIDAIAQLKLQNTVCLLVGEDQGRSHYREELEQRIKFHQLETIVKLVGGCNDMAAAYHLSDLVVSASTDPEAFGRVACEAQAMGCLVVATDHGGARETIAPEQRQWLCQPNDVDSLTNAITKALASSKQQRAEIAAHSRRHIEQQFSLDKMCTETLALYQNVLKPEKRS